MLAPVELVQHLLSFLDTATRPLLGASSAWVAIALLTVLVRVALLPLTIAQLRAARTQAELQPETGALLGVPLGTTLLAAPPPVLLALVGVLAVLATLSAWQAGRTARRAAAATPGQPTARQAATLARVLPFAVIPMAAWLPLAVVVYLAAGNLFTVLQQAIARVH